ncbi:alpha/beta fold hydrolase [Synechococcus sp. CCY9202]|uniref:alpha/beta fold hydrolase n=1 Tax=Synechococcus sp. CCY9202 TaxID=174698 RepID=UPI002B1F35C8|nr:alpha/beta fold hydrolase [Synechococcus sp. CCY9202]MEA5423362.1 alpha/beta fold hydrolase [Synechococcus sp. CCY9202]
MGRSRPSTTTGASTDWGEAAVWRWQGLVVHWRWLGDRRHPPLLLVHGFAAGSGHWRHNAPALADAGWCVYALDLVGFGASSQPAAAPGRTLDNRLWARQLQAFLEQVVQAPAVLIGHSLGGLVALSCAVYFPTWVRGMVAAPLPDPALLAASAAIRRETPCWRRLKRWTVRLLCRLLPLELIVPLLAHSPLLGLGIQSAYLLPVLDDLALHRLIALPARRPGAARALRAMSVGMALRPHGATAPALLQRLRQPLLLLWGRDDRLVPARVAEQCRAVRPELPLVLLEQAGHCPHDEQPEAFHQAVLPWLAALR